MVTGVRQLNINAGSGQCRAHSDISGNSKAQFGVAKAAPQSGGDKASGEQRGEAQAAQYQEDKGTCVCVLQQPGMDQAAS